MTVDTDDDGYRRMDISLPDSRRRQTVQTRRRKYTNTIIINTAIIQINLQIRRLYGKINLQYNANQIADMRRFAALLRGIAGIGYGMVYSLRYGSVVAYGFGTRGHADRQRIRFGSRDGYAVVGWYRSDTDGFIRLFSSVSVASRQFGFG